MSSFTKVSIKIGTITLSLAIIFNFFPVLYLAVVHHVFPSKFITLFVLVASARFVSWIVQPLSYFGVLGTGGTYMSWLSGSVGDIRMPAARMAQKVTGYEGGTPEGDVIATLGVAASNFITFSFLSVFVLIGAGIMPYLPKFILSSFTYILPSLFAAVYIDMMSKDRKIGILTIILTVLIFLVLPKLGVPSGIVTLCTVIGGISSARLVYVMNKKNNN